MGWWGREEFDLELTAVLRKRLQVGKKVRRSLDIRDLVEVQVPVVAFVQPELLRTVDDSISNSTHNPPEVTRVLF